MKIEECYHDARQKDDQRKSFVQQILQKSTDFLRRIIDGREGSHCRRCALAAVVSPIEDYNWWVSTRHGKRQCDWNRVLVIQDSTHGPQWDAGVPGPRLPAGCVRESPEQMKQ